MAIFINNMKLGNEIVFAFEGLTLLSDTGCTLFTVLKTLDLVKCQFDPVCRGPWISSTSKVTNIVTTYFSFNEKIDL